MKLSQLLKSVESIRINSSKNTGAFCVPEADPDISSIHCSSRDVRPGGLFVAVRGFKADGHDFIDDAIRRGAVAVVVENPVETGCISIRVENSRKALSALSAEYYENPSRRMCVIGITGTNGKTTTSYLIERILAGAGCNVGVIGTVNYRFNGQVFDNPMTTPESLDLQSILSDMCRAGVTHVVVEVSSHAIDLHRIDHCWMDIGVFTNLSHDHHDYHGDMDRYWACKKRLFTDRLTGGPKKDRARAVVNCNDPRGRELAGILTVSHLTSGHCVDNDIHPVSVRSGLNGMTGAIVTPKGRFDFQSPLVGNHNLENIMCATAAGVALDIPVEKIKAGIETTTRVPGRLEPVPDASGRFVYVDYAHTPDALENVLRSLRPLTDGRMICVFGCGGDRDVSKRPEMGEIAGTLCDLAVVTSDNPRTENPDTIIEQVLEGVRRTSPRQFNASDIPGHMDKKGCLVEPDRRRAIELAIRAARPGDTVLIAGKGHETYQIIGNTTIDFDDVEEAHRILMHHSASIDQPGDCG